MSRKNNASPPVLDAECTLMQTIHFSFFSFRFLVMLKAQPYWKAAFATTADRRPVQKLNLYFLKPYCRRSILSETEIIVIIWVYRRCTRILCHYAHKISSGRPKTAPPVNTSLIPAADKSHKLIVYGQKPLNMARFYDSNGRF